MGKTLHRFLDDTKCKKHSDLRSCKTWKVRLKSRKCAVRKLTTQHESWPLQKMHWNDTSHYLTDFRLSIIVWRAFRYFPSCVPGLRFSPLTGHISFCLPKQVPALTPASFQYCPRVPWNFPVSPTGKWKECCSSKLLTSFGRKSIPRGVGEGKAACVSAANAYVNSWRLLRTPLPGRGTLQGYHTNKN